MICWIVSVERRCLAYLVLLDIGKAEYIDAGEEKERAKPVVNRMTS